MGKKYDEEIKRGNKYKEAKRTICIIITCFNMEEIKEIGKFHTKWNIREEEYSDIILTSKLEFHIINLSNLDKVINTSKKEKELLNWCKFIVSPETMEESIMEENDKILKAKEVLDRLNEDEEEREMAYRRQRAIMDQDAIREAGYDEGLEAGIKQGVEQGEKNKTIELAKKMLSENINLESILKITGLTIDEINALIK